MLKTAVIEVTSECNLRCKHCYADSKATDVQNLPLSYIRKCFTELKKLNVESVVISGGEPYLRNDLASIIHSANMVGIIPSISTNGTVYQRLKDCNIRDIQVSIDGWRSTHEGLRGRPGAYDDAVSTIKKLKADGYTVTINQTVFKKNVSDVSYVIDLALELGVDGYCCSLLRPVGRGANIEPIDMEQMVKLKNLIAVRRVELKKKLTIGTQPTNLFNKKGEAYECSGGIEKICIKPNGVVVPCEFMPDYEIGTIEDSLESLLKAREFSLGCPAFKKR